MKQLLGLAVVMMLTAGCQSKGPAVIVKKHILKPANTPAMSQSKDIQIVNVAGDSEYLSNEQVDKQLSAFLANISLDGEKRFNLVNDKADTLLSFHYEVDEQTRNLAKKVNSCQPTELEDGTLGGCSTTKERCSARHVTVAFTVKLTDVSDERVLLDKPYEVKQVIESCSSSSKRRFPPYDLMAKNVFANGLKRFGADIAPYYITLDIPFIQVDAADLSDDKVSLFRETMNIAASGQMREACQRFFLSAGYLFDSPAIMYNVGVCWEVQGNPEAALGYYEKALELADKLSSKDKALVESAIERL